GNPQAVGNVQSIKRLLDHGADVKAKDPAGRSVLMLAASSDSVPVEAVKMLIERGADVNAKSANGETALDFAKRRGQTPIVDLLVKARATEGSASTGQILEPKPAGSVRAALERSIPLLQRA